MSKPVKCGMPSCPSQATLIFQDKIKVCDHHYKQLLEQEKLEVKA